MQIRQKFCAKEKVYRGCVNFTLTSVNVKLLRKEVWINHNKVVIKVKIKIVNFKK